MINLPNKFVSDMKDILEDEFTEFIGSYNENRTTGLRVNTLKISVNEFKAMKLFSLKQIPWCEEGFYYDELTEKPGKHPLHAAGAYYIQEPSAMAAVPELDIEPGDVVLDMCAAPGGKSTYIASKLQGKGLLISNEIDSKRVKALGENMERLGVRNAIITNTSVNKLAGILTGYFDKVLIDAPCSGEGMFRKDEEAIRDWSYEKVTACAAIQRELIKMGFAMLKPGGILVYSTCTFSREENEDIINNFIKGEKNAELLRMKRLWPHRVKGEGHFVAKISKGAEEDDKISTAVCAKALNNKKLKNELKDYYDFQERFLNIKLDGKLELRGENLYLLPDICPNLNGITVLRPGFFIGELKKNRFEPSHALAQYLRKEDAKNVIDFQGDSQNIMEYLKGNTLNTGSDKGWTLVCCEGVPIGWGKESKGVLKNHYPKGLRIF